MPARILSRRFGEDLQAVRDKIRDGKLGFEATPTVEDKLSKTVSLLKTSGWWDSVSSFDVATATEPLAEAAKGGPTISSSHQSQ